MSDITDVDEGLCRICNRAMMTEDGLDPDDACHPCLIAELEAKLSKFDWQPIDTVPNDGTCVLLFDQERGFVIGYRFERENPPSTMWILHHNIAFQINPSHWMPLPEGPK